MEFVVGLIVVSAIGWFIVKLIRRPRKVELTVSYDDNLTRPFEGEVLPEPSPTHREDAIAKARTLLKGNPLVIDTESTGIGKEDQIIEIALVDLDGEVVFESLVRPSIAIHPDAQAIHQILPEELAEAPTFSEIVPQLRKVIGDKALVAFNYEFDIRMIRQSLLAEGKRLPNGWGRLRGEVEDTNCIMKLYAEYYGQWNNFHHGYRWQGQQKALEQCGITIGMPAHRASTDALGALALLKHIAESSP